MAQRWFSDFAVADGTALENISAPFWVRGNAYQFVTSGGQLVLQNYSAPYSVDLASQQIYVDFSITYQGGAKPQIIVGICNSGYATTTPDGPYVDLNTAGKIYLRRQYASLATINYAPWLSVVGTKIKVRLEQNSSAQTILTVWDSSGTLVASQTVSGVSLGGTYATIYGYGSVTTPPKAVLDELGVYDYASSTQTVSLSAAWRVLTDQDLSAAWRVLRMEEAAASWRVLARTDAAAAWRVLAATEIQAAWRVVSAAALEAAWRVMRSEDLSAAWAVLARQGVSLSAAWRVLAESSQLASWMVKTSSGLDAGWRVLTTSDRQVAWAVKKAVEQDASWRVLTSAEIEAAWAVLSDLVVMPPASRTVSMAVESRTVAISYESRTIIMLEE